MRRILMALGLALANACATGERVNWDAVDAAPGWRTLDGKAPIVIAHRGASGYLPEHTLEAYALAIEQGADVVEPDLVFTKDGVLVARHDRYLSTTTNVADKPEFAGRRRANGDPKDAPREDWWVEDFTLAELKTLRARQPFAGRAKTFDGLFEVPTFAEVLALVARKSREAGRPVGVYPETKHPAYFTSIGHGFDEPLLEALAGFDAGPVFVQSFEPEILKRLKGKTNAKLVQLVFEKAPGAGPNIPLADIAAYADGVGPAKALILSEEGVRSSLIEDAHARGLFVHVWTFRNDQPNAAIEINQRIPCPQVAGYRSACFLVEQDWTRFGIPQTAGRELRAFMDWGVDGLFADFPDTAVKVRSETPMARQEALRDAKE